MHISVDIVDGVVIEENIISSVDEDNRVITILHRALMLAQAGDPPLPVVVWLDIAGVLGITI